MQSRFKYRFTSLAASDIEETLDYISVELANPTAARALFAKIEKAIDDICIFPFGFSDCKCFLISDRNIRHIQVDNYVIIYEVKEQIGEIHILRFRYSMMDLKKMKLN